MADALTGGFFPTDPNHISAALGAAVSEREERGLYRVSSSTNMIVVASCRGKLSELNDIIDALSIVNPGRYFAIYREERGEELRVEVSARCYGLSKHESLCSEVIMIGAPAGRTQAVPSVIFAHLLTGNPVELFLCDPCTAAESIQVFLPICARVLLSSSQYFSRPAMLREIAARVPVVVDLDWLNLGVWRRQIAGAFDRPALRRQLPELRRVRIKGECIQGSQAYLLAGWVAACLAARVTLPDGRRCMLEREEAGAVELTLVEEHAGHSGVSEVSFELGSGGRAAQARFVRGQGLETIVEDGERYYAREPLADAPWGERFRLYFEAGESIAGYRRAFEKALEISAL